MLDPIEKVRSTWGRKCEARKSVRTKAVGLGDKRCRVRGITGDMN